MTEMFEKNDLTAKLLSNNSYIHSHVLSSSSSSSSSFYRERERDVEVKSYLPRKGMLLLLGLLFTIWWYVGILSSGYICTVAFPALLGILCGRYRLMDGGTSYCMQFAAADVFGEVFFDRRNK